tara:strand:+ start:908 stop:1066 length:159 start_codon:yes stop_codon:yes gene_type:complete
MSFGGENSSTGTTAHKHTNAVGDGSNLDETTLQPNSSVTLSSNIRVTALVYG